MKKGILVVLALFFVVVIRGNAFSFGEIFKVETFGTEYCGDYNSYQFSAKNNIDLWVHLLNETEITVSITPTFDEGTTFPMYGDTYLIGKNKAAFIGSILFQDYSYATIQGTAIFDKFGSVKSLQGTLIQNGVLRTGCFSSGKFKTVQRLQ